jgi:anti-sigma-K factor RskA
MRRTTRIGTLVATAAIVAPPWTAAPAVANGGAYLSFDQTYYAPGAEVSAEAFVYVPDERADLLERGPFWLYALPDGTRLEPGAPVPAAAIPLTTLAVRDEGRDEYRLEATFRMPAAAPGHYDVAVCNDPCTVSGFGEPLSGVFYLAGSQREIALLKENEELGARADNLEHEMRKMRKDADAVEATLGSALAERDEARIAAADLRERLAAVDTGTSASRPLIDTWAAVAIAAGLVLVAVALVSRRRGRRVSVAAAVLTVGALATGVPIASAGGSWLDIRDVRGDGAPGGIWGGWAGPGAVVTMRGTFGSGTQAPPSRGPWVADLRPEEGGPTVRLGPVDLDLDASSWVATATFTVPDVRPGVYWVDVCDAATCSIGVGDLIGGTFVVATTALEARLIGDLPRLHARIDALVRDRDRLDERLTASQQRVASLEGVRAGARETTRTLRDRVDTATGEVRRVDAKLAATADDLSRWRIVALALAALAVVAFAAALLRPRRGAPAPAVPDTPEELLEPAARR